ncbi:hypothetical protein QU768_15655 [Proteus mirabilis]|uniref:hypothetical protein n=1 Tax=Proteus mirabilis TaxID=584 RepID=UPI001A1EE689|nr:hypothetical protein [Proteus mirabilis]MBI6252696.1 hypothetical protein [Proteus mirabilis]MBI6290045.1 hypothetical protein [Proteus mirabilis]MDM9219989.1 hypothetical protein [Proteus mirabilis]WOQ85332.1 hypothetical protein R2B79_08120 [Proteus mirabilis]
MEVVVNIVITSVSIIASVITIWQACKAKSAAVQAKNAAISAKKLLSNNRKIEKSTQLVLMFKETLKHAEKIGPGCSIDKLKGLQIDDICSKVNEFIGELASNHKKIFNNNTTFTIFYDDISNCLSKITSQIDDNEKLNQGQILHRLLISISNPIHNESEHTLNNTDSLGVK